jgi:hypothetical protein
VQGCVSKCGCAKVCVCVCAFYRDTENGEWGTGARTHDHIGPAPRQPLKEDRALSTRPESQHIVVSDSKLVQIRSGESIDIFLMQSEYPLLISPRE